MKTLSAYPLFLLIEFAAASFFGMIFVASTVYQVTTVGLNPLQLVLVGTTLEISAFIGEVPTGVVADAYSRRLSIIIGYALMGLGFIVEGSFALFEAILVGQVLWGIGYTFTSGATQAWLTDEIGETNAGRALIRAEQVGNVGAIIGIAIGAALGSLRINLPILIGGTLLIALSALLILTMPERGFKPTPRENRNSFQHIWHIFTNGLAMTRKRPALLTIFGIGLFIGLYSEGVDRLWTPHFLKDFTFPSFIALTPVMWMGALRIVSLGLGIGANEIARRRVDTNSHHAIARAMFGLTFGMVLALFTFALSDQFLFALASYWTFASLRQVVGTLYFVWVNQRLDSSVRATVLSMSSQVDALGQMTGGPILGAIGSAFSIRAALAASSIILSPVVPLSAVSAIRGRRGDEMAPEGIRGQEKVQKVKT